MASMPVTPGNGVNVLPFITPTRPPPVVSLVPIAIPLIFLSLHVMVSVVQAFLFMALAMSYLSLAVAQEH